MGGGEDGGDDGLLHPGQLLLGGLQAHTCRLPVNNHRHTIVIIIDVPVGGGRGVRHNDKP